MLKVVARGWVRGGLVVLVVLALGGGARSLDGQVQVGGHGVYQSQLFDGTFGLGGRAMIDLGFIVDGMALLGTYDHFFPDCSECSFWEAGGGLVFSGGSAFYLGAGAAFQRFERAGELAELGTTDDWAFNLIAGLQFPAVPVVTPFVEARMEVGSETTNQQTFSVGVSIGPRSGAPGRRGRR